MQLLSLWQRIQNQRLPFRIKRIEGPWEVCAFPQRNITLNWEEKLGAFWELKIIQRPFGNDREPNSTEAGGLRKQRFDQLRNIEN